MSPRRLLAESQCFLVISQGLLGISSGLLVISGNVSGYLSGLLVLSGDFPGSWPAPKGISLISTPFSGSPRDILGVS